MPTYDLRCLDCGREWERASTIAARYEPCETCAGAVEQVFKHSVQSTPFVAYFDFALGKQINGLGDRRQAMKGEYDPHTGKVWGQLDYRDKMSKGDLSARDDRVQEQKRIEARRG